MGQVGGQPLTDGTHGLDRDHRRKNAGKKSVQPATVVSAVPSLVTVVMESSLAALIMGVVVVGLKSDGGWDALRVSKRRRHNARELGDQEQGDQHANKTSYRTQPLHQRLGSIPQLIGEFAAIGAWSSIPV